MTLHDSQEVVRLLEDELGRLGRSLDRVENTAYMTAVDHARAAVRIAEIRGGIDALRDVLVAIQEGDHR